MAGLAIRIFIIAVIVVGGLVFRDRITGAASDLKVGDCFDTTEETSVKDIQHHPCDEAHNAEVVLVTNHTAVKGTAYPSDAALNAWGDSTCVPAIIGYVGAAADLSTLNYGLLYPKEGDWGSGDRQMICYATTVDLRTITRSLHAATP